MKRLLYLLFIAFTLISCSGKENIIEDVVNHHEDGSPKVIYYYKILDNGKQVCIRENWFYSDGTIQLDGPIVNDKRNGIFETYYNSAKILSKGEFVDGKREGKATIFYENGKKKYEGYYKNGKECGIWKFYDEDGKLYNEQNRDIE